MAENKIVEQTVDNAEKPEIIHRYFHEAEVARLERLNRRMFVIMIALIIALVGSWVGFWVYEAQFEDVVMTEIDQDTGEGGGTNYIVGGDFHGTSESATGKAQS